MERITSFSVDHNILTPGLYISRKDGPITTYDLRFKKPNTGDLLSNSELHSTEHLIATLLRNSAKKEGVIYFGPMGCQTGFYFLADSRIISEEEIIPFLTGIFDAGASFEGPMPGQSAKECGNYINLSLEEGRRICAFYADLLKTLTKEDLIYKEAQNEAL